MTQEVGQLIRSLREDARLSQNALARAAGIDPTNLNRIERGRQGLPRQATILRIIRGLGLSLADERAQRLLMATTGETDHTAAPSLNERAPDYDQLLAPTIRELRASLFRALELVGVLEELTTERRTSDRTE